MKMKSCKEHETIKIVHRYWQLGGLHVVTSSQFTTGYRQEIANSNLDAELAVFAKICNFVAL